jgi:hypothetical protein
VSKGWESDDVLLTALKSERSMPKRHEIVVRANGSEPVGFIVALAVTVCVGVCAKWSEDSL